MADKDTDVARAYFSSNPPYLSSDEENDKFSILHAEWITKAHSLTELRSQAGEWKRGRWTAQELKTLKHNVKEFLQMKKIKDPAQIIFSKQKDKIRWEFYRYIARNIRRPLFSVYSKAYGEFNVANYVHKWSDDLEQQLLRQHAFHGNRWAVIGRAIGVSARAAKDKHKHISNRTRTGEWAPEEEDRLVAAMRSLHGDAVVDEVAVCSSVTWAQVATHVGTRNGMQCRLKWLFTWPGSDTVRKRWRYGDDLMLLNRLMEGMEAEDEDEVDWAVLSSGWENSRSPCYLRSKWACLRRHVPNHSLQSYTENLEYLVEHLVPALERRIKKDTVQTET